MKAVIKNRSTFIPHRGIFALLLLALLLNFTLWFNTHKIQPAWPNVPPAPSKSAALFSGLGDSQLSFRLLSFPLQQMGNEGGRVTPLYMYDYNKLGAWFNVLYELDATSNYPPYLAAYYYGATQEPERQLAPVIEYLARVGQQGENGKWRWLAQAAYLAFHKKKEHAYAIEIAHKLAALPVEMPHWARQMPAILSAESGDNETALKLMRSILIDMVNNKDVAPNANEINFLIDFICHRAQTPEQAQLDPVCNAGE